MGQRLQQLSRTQEVIFLGERTSRALVLRQQDMGAVTHGSRVTLRDLLLTVNAYLRGWQTAVHKKTRRGDDQDTTGPAS